MSTAPGSRKPLHFIGSALKDLRELPPPVQDVFGAALLDVQYGDTPEGARPFGEGVSGEVWKVVEDYDRDTYRAAYTATFPRAVYVLHVFKKKSKHGVATPKPDVERVAARLAAAARHYREHYPEPDPPHSAPRSGR